MRIFLIVLLIVNLILFLSLVLKCKVDYNLLENKGIIRVYFFIFTISTIKFKFLTNKILLKNKNKRVNFLYYTDLASQNKVREIFLLLIFKNLCVRNLRFIDLVGKKENAFFTSLLSGGMNVAMSTIGCVLSEKTAIEKFSFVSFPDFFENKMLICFSTSISINLFKILYCYVSALIIKSRKKEMKYGHN